MSICWVHMKRKLLDLAWKDRDLRMSWSMCWGCLMQVQKKTSAVRLMQPIQWLVRQIVLLAKEKFGSERSASDIFSYDISFSALPTTWQVKLPLYCYKIVSSKGRSGAVGRFGPLFKILQTRSIIDYCNILRSNNFHEDKWSFLLHIPCTLSMGRCHNFQF